MRIDAIATGTNPPEDINVIIEVPVGGEPIKYEMDKASGTLVVDRFLYTPMRYPGNYGFVPHTLSDGRRPDRRGGLRTRGRSSPAPSSTAGRSACSSWRTMKGGDEKVIAVPSDKLTLTLSSKRALLRRTCPRLRIQQIEHFFAHYKDLEPGKWVKIVRWGGVDEAEKMIVEAIERAKAKAK
jgi:inorganic pyrophosphatase